MLSCITALAALAVAQSPAGSFLPQCVSDNDYGWPRFQSREELINSKWKIYFEMVYGELPAEYPVCIYDFWDINHEAYLAAGLNGTRPVVTNTTAVREGDLYIQQSTTGVDYGIYHGHWAPIPNNTWIEVTHAVFPTELKGSWVWTQRGSGVWYNVGRSVVFPTPADSMKVHADAIAWLRKDCSVKVSMEWPQMKSDIFGLCAREKGIDTIQFEPQAGQSPVGTFGLTGLTEMVLVNIDGDKTCRVEDPTKTPLRSGWKASHQCDCVNEPIPDSCGLMPKPPSPFNIIGEKPPLCELRAESRKNKCNPTTCKSFHCRLQNMTHTRSEHTV